MPIWIVELTIGCGFGGCGVRRVGKFAFVAKRFTGSEGDGDVRGGDLVLAGLEAKDDEIGGHDDRVGV
jgi:hypothetical protein